jgi:hypothetical protein
MLLTHTLEIQQKRARSDAHCQQIAGLSIQRTLSSGRIRTFKAFSSQVIREIGTRETSAEVLVGPPGRMVFLLVNEHLKEARPPTATVQF